MRQITGDETNSSLTTKGARLKTKCTNSTKFSCGSGPTGPVDQTETKSLHKTASREWNTKLACMNQTDSPPNTENAACQGFFFSAASTPCSRSCHKPDGCGLCACVCVRACVYVSETHTHAHTHRERGWDKKFEGLKRTRLLRLLCLSLAGCVHQCAHV